MRIYIYPRNIREREKGSEREREFSVLVWGVHVPVSLLNHISTVHLLNWHLVVYCLIMVKSDLVCNKKYFCIVLGKHSHKSFFRFTTEFYFIVLLFFFFLANHHLSFFAMTLGFLLHFHLLNRCLFMLVYASSPEKIVLLYSYTEGACNILQSRIFVVWFFFHQIH